MASAPCTAWEWGTRPRPHARLQWLTCAWRSSCALPALGPRFGCGWSCIAFPNCLGWAGSAWLPAPLRPSRRGGRSTSGRLRPALDFTPARKLAQLDELGTRRQWLEQKSIASWQLMAGIPKTAGKATNLSVHRVRSPVGVGKGQRPPCGECSLVQSSWCDRAFPPGGAEWERSLHYECLQPKPARCPKQLRADVEPMIIFWVGLARPAIGLCGGRVAYLMCHPPKKVLILINDLGSATSPEKNCCLKDSCYLSNRILAYSHLQMKMKVILVVFGGHSRVLMLVCLQ